MSEPQVKAIRATLNRLTDETYGCFPVIRELHERDPKVWATLGHQRGEWSEWVAYQKRWSNHKCPIDPTCRPSTVRYHVQRINALWEAISALGHEFRRNKSEDAYGAALTCYWAMFKELQTLETYLIMGDEEIRKYRRKVAQ